MTYYFDSSAVLRVVLGQPGAMRDWRSLRPTVASTLVEVECLRTLDRLRLQGMASGERLQRHRQGVHEVLEGTDRVEPDRAILLRASQPLPSPVGCLDAIHLATALMWHEQVGEALTVVTHDLQVAAAARALDLPVIGT